MKGKQIWKRNVTGKLAWEFVENIILLRNEDKVGEKGQWSSLTVHWRRFDLSENNDYDDNELLRTATISFHHSTFLVSDINSRTSKMNP